MGWLSGFGWGLGYCGGLIALFVVLAVSRPAMFGLAPADASPLFGLDPGEHIAQMWLPWQHAMEKVFSPSNRDAIWQLPKRSKR